MLYSAALNNHKISVLDLDQPLFCIAHRGGMPDQENTLAAIEQAIHLGVDAIEIDVWNVKDELLVHHDRRLNYGPFKQQLIVQQSPTTLRQAPLPSGAQMPTLTEVIDRVKGKTLLNIELKGPGCVRTVSKAIERHVVDEGGCFDNFLLSSFDHIQLYKLKQRLPEVRRGALVTGIPLNYAACCDELEAYSFHPCIDFLRQGLIDDARKRGLKTWVYTVNHEDDMRHLAAMGVDGVFTDQPQRLLNLNAQVKPGG